MLRLRRLFSFSSFRSKIMLVSLLCLLLPVLISINVYNALTREEVKEQAIANAQESLRLVEGYVSKSLQGMLAAANFVQLDSDMSIALKRLAFFEPAGETDEYEKFSLRDQVLERISTPWNIGGNLFITIRLINGEALANYSLADYAPQKLYEELWTPQWGEQIGYQSYWIGGRLTPFIFEKSRSPYQISLARTLRDATGRVFGYVIVTMLEIDVNQQFVKLAAGQDIALVDTGGTIVSHANSSRIGSRFEYADATPRSGLASTIAHIGDQDYLVTGIALPFTEWKLVSLRPYAEAAYKINSIFNRVFLFQVVCAAVFLLLLMVLIRRITVPLVRLGQVVKKVEIGNLEVRAKISGSDEVGHLGRSFDRMLDRIQEMIEEISVNQTRKREAEMAMLQAQINPHFLFNVLNSIRMKILRSGDKSSADMLTSLARLLRMTIDPKKENVSFADEIQIVEDYVRLMNMRQKEWAELRVEIGGVYGEADGGAGEVDGAASEADGEVLRLPVPRFFLQPIIENAMIHGLNQRAGLIRLTAVREGGFYVVKVIDDGLGMDEGQLEALRRKLLSGEPDGGHRQGFSGIGVSNVYERMRMQFGPSFRMEVESVPGEGTTVTMRIPVRDEEVKLNA
ncbi:sensor histidine kinase [Paenibacillus koleovorans]|uniref:sensor histidine kinase n=1 Tax=Paenibacillus koleovorans TaxID=121608 RepID=UPI000FD9507F|nr:sensor histidine kinase [Paenibacillus koleovorans]